MFDTLKIRLIANIQHANAELWHVSYRMPFTCNAAIVNKACDVLASFGRFNLQPTETMYQLVSDDVNIYLQGNTIVTNSHR